jgi:putative tricarboxylic transport membrane protein
MICSDMEAGGEDANAPHGLWATMAWFMGLLILSGIFGLVIALSLFLFGFFRFRAGLSWAKAAVYSASGIAFMLFLAWVLNRDFPPGLLQHFVSLPWPLK